MASVMVIFGGQEQSNHELDKPKMVVGRDATCEIHIDNLGISRQHCAFLVRSDAFVVQDLNSSNGTYVNQRKITEHFLNDGDEVVIGKYTLKFKNQAQVAAPAAAPAGSAPVPETLNTYVMDGAKIQEQLAKMKGAQPPAPGAPPGAPAQPATARDYARALDPVPVHAPAPDSGGLKTVLVIVVTVTVVLVVVLGLIMAGVININKP